MQYDVIIVLAGGITDDGQLPVSVINRIQVAKQLFDQKLAGRIVMSGKWSTYRKRYQPPWTEAEAMVRYARSLGLSSKVLYKEEESHNTVGNVDAVKRLFLKPRNWKKIIIVTSKFHLPRVKDIVGKSLGESYVVRYETAETPFSVLKWVRWHVGERVFLTTNRFLKHFL